MLEQDASHTRFVIFTALDANLLVQDLLYFNLVMACERRRWQGRKEKL